MNGTDILDILESFGVNFQRVERRSAPVWKEYRETAKENREKALATAEQWCESHLQLSLSQK